MKPNFFGLNIDHAYPIKPGQKIQTKTQSIRFHDSGCRWPDLNTAPHTFNPMPIQNWLAVMKDNGITDALFEMGTTPTWAATKGCNAPSDYNPGGCCPPSDLNPDGSGPNQLWKDWIGFVLSVLPSDIKFSFEPWNEFTTQPDNMHGGACMWAGTPAQMVRLCTDLYTMVKKARPEAIVTSPSVPLILDHLDWDVPNFMSFWKSKGAQAVCDVIAVHPYGNVPSQVLSGVTQFQQQIKDGGAPNIRFWSTEGSYGATAPADTAQFVHDYMMGLYELVDRHYWYAYGPNYAPLVDADNVLTAAGQEWNKVVDSLESVP